LGSLPLGVEAFEHLQDAVIVVDSENNVVYVNSSATKLFSSSKENILGKKTSETFTDFYLSPEDSQTFEASLHEKGSWSGKKRVFPKHDSEGFIANISFAVIRNSTGKRQGTTIVITPNNETVMSSKNADNSKEKSDFLSEEPDIERQELANIIDADTLQSMMDELYKVTKIGFAIIDLKGNVLASAGWQDICVKFHRTNPQTLWNCLESDIVLTQGVPKGEFKTYKCRNNMWDIVTPITIGNKHVGNLFSGQFFFDDETVDRNLFAQQAEKYGFDKEAYLSALDRVPRWNRAVVMNLMQFYAKLSQMISRLSFTNLKLTKSLSDQKQIEKRLRQNHHDLTHAQEVAKTGSWRLNIQENELQWSDESYRIFNVPKGTPLTYDTFLGFVHPEDKKRVDESWKAALRGDPYDLEHRIVVNGVIFWVHEKAELEFADDGSLIGAFGTVQDITEHKVDEEKLRKLNRALRAISNSNQALMRATDEAAFLQQGCRIIVEDCGYRLVWIGFAQNDEAKSVKPMAYAGFDKGYIDSLRITWADTERGQGPTGRAIRTGHPQICGDMHVDPNFAIWRSQALERGYVSSVVLPLLSEGKAFGAISIYSREPNPFTEDEVKLLTELASDFSHGIMLLRMRSAAKRAEEAWRLSEERFSKAFNQSPAAISITRLADGRYVDVNQTFLELLEYRREEVIGHTSPELNVFANPNAPKEFFEIFKKEKSFRNVEVTFRTKSGKLLPTIVSVEKISINNQDHMITTFVNITRRKQAEEQVSRAKEEWERTFDALPDLIAIIDNKHRILRVNKAMAESLGVKAEQCIGLPCYQCVHGAKMPPEICPHVQTLEDGKEHIVKLHEERFGGDILVSTSPLKDEDGKVFASVHVVRYARKES
jgi:PAS domain S-box-containing protein